MARQQVLADVVSASRRQWLDTLRDTIAKYQAVINRVAGVMRLPTGTTVESSEVVIYFERLTYLYMKMMLLLNPK